MSNFNAREYIKKKYNKTDEEESKTTQKKSNTGFNARNYISEKYRKQRADEFGLDTFESDLNSMGTTIKGIYDGWQTEETMKNTRSSIEAMQTRINAYQEYQKKYGGADLSELANKYKSVLEGWDDLTYHYSKYKTEDDYKKALADSEKAAKEKEGMKTADLNVVQSEIDKLQEILDNANSKKPKTNTITKKGAASNEAFKQKGKEQEELDNYLKSFGYSSIDDVEKALSEKKVYKNKAQRIQDGISLSSVGDKNSKNYDADFEKYVAKGDALKSKRNSWYESGYKNQIGYLRDNPEMLETYEDISDENGAMIESVLSNQLPYLAAKYMTDDEYNLYSYYLGKGDEESAEKYLSSIEERIKTQQGTDIAAERDSILSKYSFGYKAGIDQFTQGSINLFNTEDSYIPATGIQNASSQIREDIDKEHGAFGQGAYDLITTTSNMAPSILASAISNTIVPGSGAMVGAGLMGGSAAGNAYTEFLNQGYEKGQARTYSTLVGISEAGLSYALGGISKLGGKLTGKTINAIANGVDNALGRFAIKYGLNMASEGFEEAAQEVLNPFFENLALGYAKNDFSDVEWEEVAYNGVLGALSAGFLEGGSIAVSTFGENAKAKKTGANIRNNERVNEMLEVAGMTPQETDAYNLYTHYAKKGINADNVSDLQLGRLYGMAKQDAQTNIASSKSSVEQKVSAIKTLNDLSKVDTENTDVKRKKELSIGESTEVTSTGNSATIEGIKLSEDNTTLVTTEGEISINDMTLSDKDADLVIKAEGISNEYGEEMGNLFLSQYDGETNVEEYATSFNLAMAYAKHNFTQDMMLENKGVLSSAQVQAIYNATIHAEYVQQDNNVKAITEKQSKAQFVKGIFDDSIIDYNSTTTDGSKVNWKDLESKQRKAIKFAQLFSKATGVNIKFIKSEVKFGKHKGKNGSYDPNTNTIEIDVYAGRIDAKSVADSIIPTLSHEVTHWMKYKAPAIYESIREDIMKTLSKGNEHKLTENELVKQEMLKIKRNHPEKEVTPEDAIDELVARACEDMLSNSNAARKLLNKMSATEQQDFISKVQESFENLIQWVNDLLAQYQSFSEEAEILRNYKDMLKKVSKQWDAMLVESIAANQALKKEGITGEALAKKVTNKATNSSIQEMARDRYWYPNMSKSEIAYVRRMAKRELNTTDNYIDIGNKWLYNKTGDNTYFALYSTAHEDNPTVLYACKGDTAINEYLWFMDLIEEMETVKNERDDLRRKTINEVLTSFGYALDGDGIHSRQSSSTRDNQDVGVYSDSSGIEPSRALLNCIRNIGKNQKQNKLEQYSDRDNLGNTLTEAQQSYFAESKVRDENGNLKVMYHGTPNATFTKFRSGTYFTEHKWYADNYQNQGASSLSYKKTADNPDTYAVYLDIKKPFDTRNKAERDIFYNEYYRQWGTGTDLMESGLPDWLDGQDLQEFLEEQGYDYDGLILDEGATGGYGEEVTSRGLSYVVFNPEQVKSVDNKNPTKDADYRFSDREINKNLNLIAVHGTKEEKLLKALKLEGLPGLSTAVINIDDGLANEDYGEISLVFDKHTIDPALKGNAVYGADIWSPTQSNAQVERQTSSKGIRQFESKISDLAKNVVGGTFAGNVNLGGILYTGSDATTLTIEDLSYRFDRNDTVMAAYLASQGKDVEPIMKPKTYHARFDNETLAYVLSKFQDDEYSPLSDEMLDIYVHSRDYEMTDVETQKMASIFKELMLKSGMREEIAEKLVNNRYAKDNNEETYKLLDAALRYDQDGRPNEETVDRLATSNAMEEIVSKDWDSYRKWIAEQLTDAGVFTGEEGLFNKTDRVTNSGRKTFKQSHIPITAENIVKLMNKEENRGVGYYGFGVEGIQSLTASKYSSIDSIRADKGRLKKLDADEYNAIISTYNQKLTNLVKEIAEYSDVRLDTVSEAFKDAAKGARTTASIRKAYSFYDIKISDEFIKESQKLYNEVAQIPSKYFEAKASRVVGFNEIRKAVIPDSSSKELVYALEEKGIPYTTYKHGDNEERLEIIRSLDDVKFSDRDTAYMEAVNNGDMETAQRLVDEAAKSWGAYYENGNPLKFSHGTKNKDFTVFQKGDIGFHFGTKEQSKTKAGYITPEKTANPFFLDEDGEVKTGRIIDAYLKMDNPLTFSRDLGEWTVPQMVWYFEALLNNESKIEIEKYDRATQTFEYEKVDPKEISDIRITEADRAKLEGMKIQFERDTRSHVGESVKDYTYSSRSSELLRNFLISKGYDSIKYLNEYEGTENDYSYAVFFSNQIKSADTVTYDDNGNVIPLSERFNPANEDIRYSDRDIEVYDRTAILKETTIDKYLREYASKTSPNYAQAYITYMSPDKFLRMTTSYRDNIEAQSKEFNYDEFEDYTLFQPIQLIIDSETGEVNGHEGRHRMVALSNAGVYNVPVLMFDYSNKTNKENISEMVLHGQFNSYLTTRVQDVIPFNYANREEIIKKFGTQSSWQKMKERYDKEKTLMYSDRDNVSVYDTMGETNRLIKENEKLKEDVERLKERLKIEKQVTHGNYFNKNQLDAVAGHIRNIANSNYSKKDLITLLDGIYSYIAHSPDLNWYDMFAQCYDIAGMVLNEAKPITERNEYYEMILNDIRGKAISVDSQHIQNAKYRWGNRWHNKFFNRIKITDNAISLDSQWKEWTSEYPDIFDEGISPADQLVELYDIYDSVKEGSELVVEYDIEEQTRWLAKEIYNQYWNVSPIRTTADKYEKQIKLLNFEHRRTMKEFRNSYEEKLKTQHKSDKEKAAQLVKEIRERKDKEIAEVKAKSKERMDAYKENAERKTKIQSITTKALTLNEWLLKNSKDKHIHESLKGPVANLLQAIDFSSKRMLDKNIPTQKDISLQKALSQVKDMMLEASVGKEELIDLYGHDLDDDIKSMVESVDNIMRAIGDNEFILNQMTLNDLNTLDNILKTIKQAVTKMNQFHSVHHAQGIASLGQEEIRYAEKLGNEKVYAEGSLKSGTKKMLKWTNSVPYYAFKRFGEAGKKIFEAFQDGWDKMSFNVKEVIDFTKKTYTSKEVKAWEKEIKSFDVLIPATDSEKSDPNFKPKSQKVKMTTAQVMYLYLLNKRASAKAHLLGGGIVVSNIEAKKSEVISQPEGVLLEQSEIDKIIQSLNNRQIEVADALSKFMNTVCSDWGNEVSMARFGYKAFGEPDYVPMQVDKDEISTADPAEKNNSLFKLLNMSFTKSLTEGANNRLVISSIFDIFAQHTSDMAKYNALALPVLDAFKWYNYKEIEYVGEEAKVRNTVKKSIGKAFGKDGQSYITTLLEDINGQNSLSRDKMSIRFFKNSKLASVGMNLRVILLQPTSYFRASAVMANKYLIKAGAYVKVNPVSIYGKLKKASEKAEKYCGMALWKSLGYYDTNIQRGVAEQIKHAETGYDKVVEWSMKGAGIADKATLGTLWIACDFEVRDTRKDLKVGSDEFNQAVGKRLREVIYATQVVDSTLTRSEFMRSPDGRDKILSMFASEPTLAYNILQDAYIQTNLDARELGSKKAAFKKNGKKIAKAITAYTITNAVAALVESGFDILRDDDEEEEMDIVEFMKLYLSNFAADMSIVGKIPYLKDGLSILQGYSPSRSDVQWIESAYKTYSGITKHLQGEGNPVTTIKNGIKTFSYVSGLPFFNAYRDIMATLNKLDILSSEELEEMFE